MNLKNFLKTYQKYLDEEGLICYGGNPDNAVIRSLLSDFCNLITGFRKTLITIETNHYGDDNLVTYNYKLRNGGDYQYNSVILNKKDYTLSKVKGDGGKQIKKLFKYNNIQQGCWFRK